MKHTQHKLIDAERLLLARFQEPPKNDYQKGWNDALTAAYEDGTGIIFLRERKDGET
jgi:hypothetical protein